MVRRKPRRKPLGTIWEISDGRRNRDAARNSNVLRPSFCTQAMDTQRNVLPTLPVLARTVSGCLNSAFLGLF